jgi:uncharacterized protein YggE
MKSTLWLLVLVLLFAATAAAQTPEVKFIADTLVVQADGTYEANPDLATLIFDISAQEKELKTAYQKTTDSMRKIVELAQRNGLTKEDIETGVFTVTPFYEGDRKRRARSYRVQGRIVLKVRDFSKLAPLMDESVQDDITDFRSLTYSLEDEEAAKQKAVAEAMKRAVGRASAALEQKGQKVGALRYASLDVKQLVGVAQLETMQMVEEMGPASRLDRKARGAAPPPPPMVHPEKITVSATVQCAFQIQ